MFFFFSKLFLFLIQPINWIVALLLFAVFTKNEKWKTRSRNFALILLLFFTNRFVCNLAIKSWETDVQPISELRQDYDIGIVLGGYSNFNLEPKERYHFNSSANRLTQSIELYKAGKIKKILVTGGSGSWLNETPNEAEEIKPFLIKMGVLENDIIVEPLARNTHENATFTKQILQKNYPDASCLLITSAFHMRRSKACFQKEKIQFSPFSTDILGEENHLSANFIFIPNPDSLSLWNLLIKEWIGVIVYRLKGYT